VKNVDEMKRVKIAIMIVTAAVVLLLLALGGAYWQARSADADAVVVATAIAPEELHIGEEIHVDVTIELPWHRQPTTHNTIELPDGLQLLDSEAQAMTRMGFGTWQWTVRLQLQAYDFGPFTDLQAEIEVTPKRDNTDTVVTAAIPQLVIVPRLKKGDENAQLTTGDELSDVFLKEARNPWVWIGVVAGVVLILSLIVVAIVRLLIRRPEILAPPPKPWVVAEKAMERLAEQIEQGIDAENFFVELTDIVRTYIESVFDLPATEQTTPEFLEVLKLSDKLSADHRLLLMDFLNAADMVKFARAAADQQQIMNALKSACQFVIDTSESLMRAPAEAATAQPAEAEE
jgi:hypothetical protein